MTWKKLSAGVNMSRNSIYIVLGLIVIISGCRTIRAPQGVLEKSPEEFIKSGKGGWLTIRLKAPHPEAWKQTGGEFLWQDKENIYLLRDTITVYQKTMIDMAVIEIMEKRPYAWWWILGSVSTSSHGFFLIFTFPVWQIVGIPATYGELWHDAYRQDRPDEKYWQGINVLSRFPGGVVEDFKLKISK